MQVLASGVQVFDVPPNRAVDTGAGRSSAHGRLDAPFQRCWKTRQDLSRARRAALKRCTSRGAAVSRRQLNPIAMIHLAWSVTCVDCPRVRICASIARPLRNHAVFAAGDDNLRSARGLWRFE
jgi:hypothetical protein